VADIARVHAVLTRDAEGTVIEGACATCASMVGPSPGPLRPNDRMTLGSSCQLRVRQPVPVSRLSGSM